MSRRPPRRRAAGSRPLPRLQVETLVARHGTPLPIVDCDVIREDIPLPARAIGDLLVGRTMGAYTSAMATDFNFIRRAKIVAVNRRPGRQRAG